MFGPPNVSVGVPATRHHPTVDTPVDDRVASQFSYKDFSRLRVRTLSPEFPKPTGEARHSLGDKAHLFACFDSPTTGSQLTY